MSSNLMPCASKQLLPSRVVAGWMPRSTRLLNHNKHMRSVERVSMCCGILEVTVPCSRSAAPTLTICGPVTCTLHIQVLQHAVARLDAHATHSGLG